jgi:hypothetical protein
MSLLWLVACDRLGVVYEDGIDHRRPSPSSNHPVPFCHSEQSEESAFFKSERTADSSRKSARNDKTTAPITAMSAMSRDHSDLLEGRMLSAGCFFGHRIISPRCVQSPGCSARKRRLKEKTPTCSRDGSSFAHWE